MGPSRVQPELQVETNNEENGHAPKGPSDGAFTPTLGHPPSFRINRASLGSPKEVPKTMAEDGTLVAGQPKPRAKPKGRPLSKWKRTKSKEAAQDDIHLSWKERLAKRFYERNVPLLYLTATESSIGVDPSNNYLRSLPRIAEAAFGTNRQRALATLDELDAHMDKSKVEMLEAAVAAGLMPAGVIDYSYAITVTPSLKAGGGVFISVPRYVRDEMRRATPRLSSPSTTARGAKKGKSPRNCKVTMALPEVDGAPPGHLPPLERPERRGGGDNANGEDAAEGEGEGEEEEDTRAPPQPLPTPPAMASPLPPRPGPQPTLPASSSKEALDRFGQLAEAYGNSRDPALASLYSILDSHLDAVNSRASQGSWEAPYIFDLMAFRGQLPMSEGMAKSTREEYKHYRNKALTLLREGKVAVQLIATGSEMVLASGAKVPLYNVDPFDLADLSGLTDEQYGDAGTGSYLRGLPFGPRQLLQLMQVMHREVGTGSMDKMCLIVHVGPESENCVVEDMIQRNFYGARPENVLVVVQPSFPAYSWSPLEGRMACETGAGLRPAGSGYAMQQLQWGEQAYVLSESGDKMYLAGSVLDYLEREGRCWMASNRLTDAFRYGPVVIDIDALAVTLMAHERMDAQMSVEVYEVKELAGGQKTDDGSWRSGVVMQRQGIPGFASELRQSSLRIKDIHEQIVSIFEGGEGGAGVRIPKSTSRYLYRVPHLNKILARHNAMPPVLERVGRSLSIAQDLADLTLQPDANCVALMGEAPLLTLRSEKELPNVMKIIRGMDMHAAFHELASRYSSRQAPAVVRPQGIKARQTVMLLALDDVASRKAFNVIAPLLTPGLDRLHLVTGVEKVHDIPQATKLLSTFKSHLNDSHLLEIVRDIIPLGERGEKGAVGKAEWFKKHAQDIGATLVVVGSERLPKGIKKGVDRGSQVGDGKQWGTGIGVPLGSTALAMLNGVQVPTMVVKRSAFFGRAMLDKGSFMLAVDTDGACKAALESMLLWVRRQDKCCVARHERMRAAAEVRQSLDRSMWELEEMGLNKGVRIMKRVAQGHAWADAVVDCAATERTDVLIVASPNNSTEVPAELLEVIMKAQCAVLLHRGPSEAAAG